MKIPAAVQSDLFRLAMAAALVVAVVYVVRRAGGAAVDSVTGAASQAWGAALDAAARPFGPTSDQWTADGQAAGWYLVDSQAGQILTQKPRAWTLTNLDHYMLVDP